MCPLKKTSQIVSAGAPWYTIYNTGSSAHIDCGNGASLNDLSATPPFTIEAWVMTHPTSPTSREDYGIVFDKSLTPTIGWNLTFNDFTGDDPYFYFYLYPVAKYSESWTYVSRTTTYQWHHVVGVFLNTQKSRVAADGIWGDLSTHVWGDFASDALINLRLGYSSNPITGGWLWGSLGWARISNNDRYNGASGTSFTPPLRNVIPTPDANTLLLLGMDEQSGTLINDLSGNGNHGLLTGTYAWGKGYG